MLDMPYPAITTGDAAHDERSRRPRKIRLNCDLYRPHSMRASRGDAGCDHDFESAPTVTEADFAVWNCTRCGRAFKFETWQAGRSLRLDFE